MFRGVTPPIAMCAQTSPLQIGFLRSSNTTNITIVLTMLCKWRTWSCLPALICSILFSLRFVGCVRMEMHEIAHSIEYLAARSSFMPFYLFALAVNRVEMKTACDRPQLLKHNRTRSTTRWEHITGAGIYVLAWQHTAATCCCSFFMLLIFFIPTLYNVSLTCGWVFIAYSVCAALVARFVTHCCPVICNIGIHFILSHFHFSHNVWRR